jgi:hypothetical protein
MRNMILVLAACLGLAFLAGCGAKYAEVQSVIREHVRITDETSSVLDKSNDPIEIKNAADRYLTSRLRFFKTMDALSTEMPELLSAETPPELINEYKELKRSTDKLREAAAKKREVVTDPGADAALSQLP